MSQRSASSLSHTCHHFGGTSFVVSLLLDHVVSSCLSPMTSDSLRSPLPCCLQQTDIIIATWTKALRTKAPTRHKPLPNLRWLDKSSPWQKSGWQIILTQTTEKHQLPTLSRVCFSIIYAFLPARRYASAGFCDSDVSVCLSVRLSVCLSHAGIVPSRAKAGS